MVILKRITESNEELLSVDGQNTAYQIWQKVKDKIDQTKMITLSTLNLGDIKLTNIEHKINKLYINESDKQKLIDLINKTKQEGSGVDTHIELAKQIDHSISDPKGYKPSGDSLFVTNPNNTISFIPSQYMQGIKELRKGILELSPKDKIRIEVVDKEGKSLRTLYHLDTNAAVKIVSLNISGKHNKRTISIKDPQTIHDLKGGLLSAFSDNSQITDFIKSFSFNQSFQQAEEAKMVIAQKGTLFLSLSEMADKDHKVGILDTSFRGGKVNLTMNAYKNGRYCMVKGVLKLT